MYWVIMFLRWVYLICLNRSLMNCHVYLSEIFHPQSSCLNIHMLISRLKYFLKNSDIYTSSLMKMFCCNHLLIWQWFFVRDILKQKDPFIKTQWNIIVFSVNVVPVLPRFMFCFKYLSIWLKWDIRLVLLDFIIVRE